MFVSAFLSFGSVGLSILAFSLVLRGKHSVFVSFLSFVGLTK